MTSSVSLSIVVPALDEEVNLAGAIAGLTNTLNNSGIDWEIVLVNDGSTDQTADIAAELAGGESRIKVIQHQHTMGIGRCFRDGIEASSKDAVTWFPGDGENDPNELLKYLPLLEHVDIIVPFVTNKGVRTRGRRFVSKLYLWIVNLSFGTMFDYTTGNVIYRRSVFDVVKFHSNGFIYQTECLIRSARAGFTFTEVPVQLGRRMNGRSKILTFKSVATELGEFARLFVGIHCSRDGRKRSNLAKIVRGE